MDKDLDAEEYVTIKKLVSFLYMYLIYVTNLYRTVKLAPGDRYVDHVLYAYLLQTFEWLL